MENTYENEYAKKLDQLACGDSMIFLWMEVVRVPSGWLFKDGTSLVFVPYSDEFVYNPAKFHEIMREETGL